MPISEDQMDFYNKHREIHEISELKILLDFVYPVIPSVYALAMWK